MNLILDLHQQARIAQAQTKAEHAQDRAKRLEMEVHDLRRRADALTIACQALWELLRSRLGIDDQTALNKMQEIDLRDGTQDGRISTRTLTCPACSRINNSRRQNCVYCGTRLPTGNLFEKS
jgi:hypothetical protein